MPIASPRMKRDAAARFNWNWHLEKNWEGKNIESQQRIDNCHDCYAVRCHMSESSIRFLLHIYPRKNIFHATSWFFSENTIYELSLLRELNEATCLWICVLRYVLESTLRP